MLTITSPRPERGRRRFLGVELVDGTAHVESLHPERELALRTHGYTVTTDPAPKPKRRRKAR